MTIVNPLMPRLRPRRLRINPLMPEVDKPTKRPENLNPMSMLMLGAQIAPLLAGLGGTTTPMGPVGGPPKFSSMPGV